MKPKPLMLAGAGAVAAGALLFLAPTGDPAKTTATYLVWNPSVSTNTVGYMVYWGDAPGAYRFSSNVGPATNMRVNVSVLRPRFYAVTAYDDHGIESDYSEELQYATLKGREIKWHLPVGDFTNYSIDMSTNLVGWQPITEPYVFDQPRAFYRLKGMR